MTLSGTEPATFGLVAQYLNKQRHGVRSTPTIQVSNYHLQIRNTHMNVQCKNEKKKAKYTGVRPYIRVIRSKTYRGYVKPRIIPKAIYGVIFV
jgi:hypothetical protein